MPYKSKKQEHAFRACDHGWTPPAGSKFKCPPKDVRAEFAAADARTSMSRGYRRKKAG